MKKLDEVIMEIMNEIESLQAEMNRNGISADKENKLDELCYKLSTIRRVTTNEKAR